MRVAVTRSRPEGVPPRCTWPSTVTRGSRQISSLMRAATSIALTIGALAMIAQLFRGTGIVRLVPLLKGLAATAAMSLVLYGGHALLVTADESKLMLVVKCGLTGVAGCAVYLGVSLLLRQTIMAETIRKFKK